MAKHDKRSEVIQAALSLIAEHGFHGTSMAMIAERAGVGAGTIYHYFENKDALINEIYHELEEEILVVLKQGYQISKPLRERFIYIGKTLLQYFILNPLYFRYMEQFHNSPYGIALRRDRILSKVSDRNIFDSLLEEGVTQQIIKDLPINILYALAFGPLISVVRDSILGLISLNDELIERIVEACWDGLKR